MDLERTYLFRCPTPIRFGPGAAGEVGAAARALGGRRALLVADAGVAKAGLVEPIRERLAAAGVAVSVFDEVEPTPTVEGVDRCASFAREAAPDLLVAVGGGSALDTAKAVGMVLAHEGSTIADFFHDRRQIERAIPPLIALPTTAGTGSEVSWFSVITDPESGRRNGFGTMQGVPYLAPALAIVDPRLTQSAPPHVAAATGVDALTHAIESYVSRDAHPFSDALGIRAIRMIGHSLPRAVSDREDVAAAYEMSVASTMAGIAMGSGLGLVHAIARPLTAWYGIHHGLANSLSLPEVMAFNEEAQPNKTAEIALALGGDGTRGSASEAVLCLFRAIGLTRTLADFGVERATLPKMADDILTNQAGLAPNPRPVEWDALVELLERALDRPRTGGR